MNKNLDCLTIRITIKRTDDKNYYTLLKNHQRLYPICVTQI